MKQLNYLPIDNRHESMILKTMDGVVIPVGEDEAKKIAQAINNAKQSHILVRGALIPRSSIALYPDEYWGEKSKQGRLHDGSRVVREFGRWVDARNPDVKISLEYYPELARDEVLTESEWQRGKFDELQGEERATAYKQAIAARTGDNTKQLTNQ